MDNSNNYVSLLIAIIAIIYMIASMYKSVKRPEAPHPEEEEVPSEVFVRREEAKPLPPPPPPTPPEPQYAFHSSLEDFTQKTAIDDRHLAIHLRSADELVSDKFRRPPQEGVAGKQRADSHIQQLIKSLPQEKLLFLSYEVFYVPVSKRPTPFPWNG